MAMNQPPRKLAAWLTLLLGMTLVGCQNGVRTDYDKLNLATVKGQIKLDGTPLADAYVVFEGEDLTYSFGKTDGKGNYKLMLNSEKEGILPGKKKVKIRLAGAFGAEGGMLDGEGVGESEGSSDEEGEGSEATQQVSVPNELPDSYHKDSQIYVNVASGSQEFDFDLKKDGSTTGAASP